MKKCFSLSLLLFFISSLAFAQTNPREFNFSGQLTDSSGNPILSSSITLTLKIMNNAGSCLLYEESQNINTTASNGYFNIGVGSAVGAAKRTGNDSGNTMPNIFRNAGTITGNSCTYTPSIGDARQLVVTVDDGVTIETLSAQTIRSVPTAFMSENSERVGGLAPANLLQVNTSGANVLSQSNLENIFTTLNYAELTNLLAGTSTRYNRPALNGTNTLPTLSTPSTPSAGQIWYNAGNIQYYDGSTTRTLSTGAGGVTSFNGRTGAVVPVTNDYTWAQIDKTTSTLADLTTRNAADLTGTLPDARLSGNVPFLNSNNTFTGTNNYTVGNQLIETGAPANNGMIIRGASGQSAPLSVWQNSAMTTLHAITPTGAGFGTSTPARLLHVNGAMRLTPTTTPGGVATGDMYVDSATSFLRYYNGTTWVDVGGAGAGGDFMADGTVPMTGQLFGAFGSSTTPSYTFNTDGDTGFYRAAANTIGVVNGGTERFRFEPSGLSGMAASSAALPYGVGVASPAYGFVGDTDTGMYRPAADTVGFSTAGSEKMRIDSTGRVSIGSTSTFYTLEAVNDAAAIAVTRPTNTSPGSAPMLRMQRARGAVGSPTAVQSGDYLMNIMAGGYNGVGSYDVSAKIDALVDGTPSSNQMPGALLFSTRDSTPSASPLERMRITNNGNIGINTTNPAYRLDVNGDVNVTGNFRVNGAVLTGGGGDFMSNGAIPMTGNLRLNGNWLSGDSGNEGIFVDNNGRVGIGTSNPGTIFEVVGNNPSMQTVNTRNTNLNGTNFFSAQNNNNNALLMGVTGTGFTSSGIYQQNFGVIYSDQFLSGLNIGAEGPGRVGFWTNNTERARITNDGNVGIGTTAPMVKTHVNGTLRIGDGGELCPAAGPGAMKWNGTSIQFCNGSFWADVSAAPAGSNGQIQFNNFGTFGSNSSLTWDNTNLRLGVGVGVPLYSLDVNGATNTTTGYAINGVSLLRFNTGTSNLSLGQDAIAPAATGVDNIGIGAVALTSVTSGQYNTAIGKSALQSASVANMNIAIGNASLYSNMTNNQNVAVGYHAGRFVQSDANTAIGHYALRGTSNISGGYNTGLGYQAGNTITSGAHNVLIGANAGSSLTSGSQNILIGSNAQASMPNATGELKIGSYLTGINGNVGIGTTAPDSPLHIHVSTAQHSRTHYTNSVTGPTGSDGSYIGADPTDGSLWLWNNEASSIVLGTANTARVWVSNTGNMGIGVNNPSQKLEVYNGATTGSYTTSGWTHSSDARLKHDIKPLNNSLEKILQLQGVEYRFNSDPAEKLQVGFIAQQAETVFPEVVETDNKGFKSMIYANLVAPLVEAFKSLYVQIQQHDETIAKQEAEIRALKNYICQKDKNAPFCK